MKKRIIVTLVFTLLINSMITSSSAKSDQLVWFIKRNGKDTPMFSSASSTVDKYNG